jgi:outer membrane protein assembly factor BamB
MIKFLKICLLASSLLLSACSSFTELTSDLKDKVMGKEPPNPPAALQEFKQTYVSKVIWSNHVGATNRYDFTPALEAGFVYDADAEGDLVKLDATTGKQIWRTKAAEPISGGVGIGGGLVLVGSNKGNVFAYDLNGKLLWKSKVSSEVLSAPRYFDGNVIVRTGDNHIFGIDAADGARKWVYERANPTLSLRSSNGLIVDGGAVYAGFSGGKLVAIRADNGKLLWEATVAQPKGVTEIERIADITSLPVVDGPIVYAVAYQGRVAAVDRTNGKVIWTRDVSSYSGISIEDGRLYLSHTLGSVYALDYSTSKTYWRQPALLNRRLTAPLPMGNLVAVGDLEGYVHFLNREDGSIASRIKLDGDAVMSMIQGNSSSQMMAATHGGSLYAISVTELGAKPEAAAEPTKRSEPATVPATESDGERSIMFKNNSILLPDTPSESGPGIRLPSPEPQ